MILPVSTKIQILNSNKDFFVYSVNNNNKVIKYNLTNDLHRYYKSTHTNFKVVKDLQKKILNEKFNYGFKEVMIDLKLI